MSKSITIAEGTQARNYNNIHKLRTNLIGGGTQYWVPEDEANQYANYKNLSISKNGTYSAKDEECDGFPQVNVNVGFKLITKQITENGRYYAKQDGADGYKNIKVNVKVAPPSGGDDEDGKIVDYYFPLTQLEDFSFEISSNRSCFGTTYNGRVYALFTPAEDEHIHSLYSTVNGTWEKVCDLPNGLYCAKVQLLVCNNQLYAINVGENGNNNHGLWVFNGTNFEFVNVMPSNAKYDRNANTVVNGAIYNVGGCAFNGNGWIEMPGMPDGIACSEYFGQLYGLRNTSNARKLCKLNGNSWQDVMDVPSGISSDAIMFFMNNKIHLISGLNHYSYNGKFCRIEEDLPGNIYKVVAISAAGEVFFVGIYTGGGTSYHGTWQYKIKYTT